MEGAGLVCSLSLHLFSRPAPVTEKLLVQTRRFLVEERFEVLSKFTHSCVCKVCKFLYGEGYVCASGGSNAAVWSGNLGY